MKTTRLRMVAVELLMIGAAADPLLVLLVVVLLTMALRVRWVWEPEWNTTRIGEMAMTTHFYQQCLPCLLVALVKTVLFV